MDYLENSKHGRKRKHSFFLHGITFMHPDQNILYAENLDTSVGFAALNDEKIIYGSDEGLQILDLETKQTWQQMHSSVVGKKRKLKKILKTHLRKRNSKG